jgi:hypothetical protein
MTSCRRAAELTSLSQETPLTWRQRFALGWHLCFCVMCRRFRRQMGLVQQAGRAAGQPDRPPDAPGTGLPEEARERIKRALREQGRDGPA